MLWWVRNTWWFSCRVNDIWVGHLHNSQTTPSILQDDECYMLSHDMLGFCAPGGQNRRQYVVVRCQPTCIVGILYLIEQFNNILSYMWPLYRHDTTNIGKWPMQNLLMILSITWHWIIKQFLPRTLHCEVDNFGFESLDQHFPQLQF